ncbi:MAG: hypothetical protein KF794_09945 [Xanthobacteraceae bacterium]|nr:hypothetical protein [Xanthobacteraceae bacterium]QYK44114.1 MAG: hypothetical protein KF794_09945 [Xanthobacteraceae bacterium]
MKNRKSQDPTEAALSAIEEALNIGKEAPEVAPPAASGRRGEPQPAPERNAGEEVFAPRSRSTRERVKARPAANDDRPSVGQILSALHRKPSSMPIILALGASIAWIIGGGALIATLFRDASGATMRLSEIAAQPSFLAILAAILLPPMVFMLLAMLTRRAQEMRHISRAMTEVTLRLAEPEGVSTDAIVSVGQAIRREVAALGDGIERAVARASELESMVRSEVSTLERAYDENENRVRALVDELHTERDAIIQHSARLREAIATANESFSFDIQNVADRVAGALDNATGRITDNISLRAEDARNTLMAAGETVVQTFAERSAEATLRLTDVGVEIARAIADRNEKVSETLTQSAAEMHARLADRAAGISQMIAESGQTFENTVGNQLQSLVDTVTQRGNDIAATLGAESAALATKFTEGLQTFDTTVKVFGNNVLAEMKGTVGAIGEVSRDTLAAFDERVSAKTSEVSDAVDARIARIEQTLDTRMKTLNETLSNRTMEFAKAVTDGAATTTQTVDKTIAGIGEYFAGKSQEISTVLSERTEKIDETLGGRATQIAETLDARAAQITETMDARVGKFEEMVVNRLEHISNTIEQKGVSVADHLVHRVEQVTELMRNQAASVGMTLNELADGISKNFVERVNNITGSHEVLRNEVRDILSEMGNVHSLLQSTIDTASSTLGPIETRVAEKVTAFHQTLNDAISSTRQTSEKMDAQIRDLNSSSNGVLRDVSNLTLRFEEQVRLIAASSEALATAHREIDSGIDQRRNAIEQITGILASRTSDLEERLTRFNTMLHETFTQAQGKTQDIAKLVAESTAGATQSIARQYELIRNSSEEERERTAASLKSTYNEATESVNALFAEQNQRFVEAARDLREISDDIQRTLDTTREEIRRTVFELPAETKESTAAMRRVVADQIKALAELNEIVARHGREVETPASSYSYREEEMAAVGGARPMRQIAPPRPAPVREEPAYEDDLPPAPPARSRQEPARERPRAAPPARPAADRAARLNEALNKQPPREREPEDDGTAIESLDSLSADIARMIDHEAAAEAWDRQKRGERGVFTRRLYTSTGQKAFEDIRRKYRRNGEFRETVDRYIDEFEKLLDQVSRDERGQALTRTYLTSETGKVYTLLAHAAGRLG